MLTKDKFLIIQLLSIVAISCTNISYAANNEHELACPSVATVEAALDQAMTYDPFIQEPPFKDYEKFPFYYTLINDPNMKHLKITLETMKVPYVYHTQGNEIFHGALRLVSTNPTIGEAILRKTKIKLSGDINVVVYYGNEFEDFIKLPPKNTYVSCRYKINSIEPNFDSSNSETYAVLARKGLTSGDGYFNLETVIVNNECVIDKYNMNSIRCKR